MNKEYIHKDTKTDEPLQQELQNYFQVINGTALYYEHYVKQLEQELERYKNIINTVRNCILTDISMLKTRRPEMSKEEIIMRLEATVKSLDKLKELKGSDN